ncbi:MAG TPA: peroxide stress protein YaaA [Flavobacteriales bacterium]|nr:peroxide stress protein YaaA [Flavobacteriales bacterium]
MKIIISPAKKLSNKKLPLKDVSELQFSNEAKYLVKELKNYKVNDIKKLMSLSDNLAQLNYERFQQWDLNSDQVNAAIYMFQGDVYQGLKAETFTAKEIDFAQKNLRILSGLYGLLKPLDLIFPYRLEMGTKIKTQKGKNLYDFWRDKLSKSLISEMKSTEVLVNLASNEYSRVLKLNDFPNPVITPIFKDYKNGKLKIISFFAKKARGEMCNFIIKNKITNTKNLKMFSNLEYKFSDENDKGEMLFTR